MFFSIIIPTYNNAQFLKKALESLKKQTDKNFELIVIDNYSSDDTSKVINNLKIDNLVYQKIKNNGVIAMSRNLGINISKGDWLMFLDSDDLFYENKIEFLNNNLDSNFDIACNSERIVNLDNGKSKIWRYGPSEKNIYKKMLLNGNRFVTSASVIKRDFVIKNNIFFNERKDFITAEDYDFFLNLVNKGAKVRFFNEILGDHTFYAGSQSSNYDLHKNSVINVVKHHIYNVQNFSQDKNKLWKKLQWRFSIMDFIKEFKEKNYLKSLKFLIRSFLNSPFKVSFFLIKILKNKLIRMIE